jgi:hypothetical protein
MSEQKDEAIQELAMVATSLLNRVEHVDRLPRSIVAALRSKIDHYAAVAPLPAGANRTAQEGVSRCECGSKYWENDLCVDCGTRHNAERHDQD